MRYENFASSFSFEKILSCHRAMGTLCEKTGREHFEVICMRCPECCEIKSMADRMMRAGTGTNRHTASECRMGYSMSYTMIPVVV